MFSQLGPLFKTVFRATEHADARFEIRREEKENGRRKNEGGGEEEDAGALCEDSTSVSVSALRAFLIEFLQKSNAPELSAETAAEISPPLQQAAPVSTVAARAVKAYGAMAAQNNPGAPPPASPAPPAPPEDLASLLEADEIRQIHRLIGELDGLARSGVESLSIQLDGRTFLDAVDEAVRAQKGGG